MMKNNNFEEEYRMHKEIEARYEAAKAANDEDAKAVAYLEMRELIDSMGAKEDGYSATYRSYAEAKDCGNKYINLHEAIWDEKVPETIDRLRYFGVDYFTFSCTWSGAVETAWLFTENGCTLEGLVQINSEDVDFSTGAVIKIPAYLFKIN